MPHLETYEAVDIDTEAINHLKDSTSEYKVLYYKTDPMSPMLIEIEKM